MLPLEYFGVKVLRLITNPVTAAYVVPTLLGGGVGGVIGGAIGKAIDEKNGGIGGAVVGGIEGYLIGDAMASRSPDCSTT